ncbi:MAG: hypothetical protein QM503_13590 [Bacteroidota bacterium]
MKKIKLLILVALFPTLLFSQGIEIVPFAGYMFGGSIKYTQGKLDVKDGMNYGLSVLIPVQTLVDVEINYTRMDSRATFRSYSGYPLYPDQDIDNLSTNYFQVGGISKFYSANTKVSPFGSFSLGATWFSSPDLNDDAWRFSITLGLGVKMMVSDRIGIMLRGRLMMPMSFAGVGFYAGSGGSGLSMNSYVAPLQGDFNGGLIIKLGD